jgi:hypothetical protein
MSIRLKALGLALVAALAMSAVTASAAQAERAEFTAEGGVPAVVKGEQEGTVNYFERTPGEKIDCNTVDYQATLEEPNTTITVTPHYAECEKGGTGLSTALNGCHYVLHTVGTTTEVGEEEITHAATDIVCPEEEAIEIKGPFGICVDHILPQTGLGGLTITNKLADETTPKPYMTIHIDITKEITYYHEDTAFCPWEGPSAHREDGNFVSTVIMKGYEDLNELVEGPTGPETTYKEGNEVGIHVK